MDKQYSIALTTYNRYELTINSIKDILEDTRIRDVVISDDFSTDGSFEKLCEFYRGNPKVRVIRQAMNRGMSRNKAFAVSFCFCDWVLLLDSDNEFSTKYLDALDNEQLDRYTFYIPSAALPNFDFREFSGETFSKKNINDLFKYPMGEVSCNVCNMLLHKDEYLGVYEFNEEIKGTDTLWQNYLWLKAGNKIKIVEGMEYSHLVHGGSTFMQDVQYNMDMAKQLKNKILSL